MKRTMFLFAAALVSAAAWAQDGPKITVKSMPAVVVKTVPRAGDMAVDPALDEIRVTFSKDMMTKGMSAWVQISPDHFPKAAGKIHYLPDKRTCVRPVKLEPDRTYVIWLNRGRFNTFRDRANRPAVPYLLVFHTKKKPEDEKLVSTDPLLQKIERFAVRAPYKRLAREPDAPTEEVNEALRALRDAKRTDHLPYLVEYGLRVFHKNLTESRLAREMPVEKNMMLAELVRLAKISKYRTAHEAGWLDRQFHARIDLKGRLRAKFKGQGYSSYQVYLWAREHNLEVADAKTYPNHKRLSKLMLRIEATAMHAPGGGKVCHYGCR